MDVRQAAGKDAQQIAEIYNWYIENTIITFETQGVSPAEMAERIRGKMSGYDWIVGECEEGLVGYAYYGAFRPRPAYDHTVETTIYLAPNRIGQGFGAQLYKALIASAKARGFRELIGIIALPNPESIHLHRKLGFVDVGVLKKAGYKLGRYVDVGIWQMSLYPE